MPRKKKVSELTEANGKDLTAEAEAQRTQEALAKQGKKPKPTSLAQIFGLPPSIYEGKSSDEYQTSLDKMNQIELQHECVRVGRTPRDSRDKNVELLMKVYTEYHVSREPITRQPVTLKISDKLAKVLRTLQR